VPPLRIAVAGASGKLGSAFCALVGAESDLALVARIAPSLPDRSVAEVLVRTTVDVLVDVTRPDAVVANVEAAIAHGVPCVVGTTGFAAAYERLDADARAAGVPVLVAPNFAIGAVLLIRFAEAAAAHLRDAVIVEEHAPTKLDRPSGTAALTADRIARAGAPRPEIASVRLPGVVANQSVIFGATGQTLELRHVTTSRDAFVPGMLAAVRGVRALPAGLHVGLEHVLFD
jgi:4-hydroxy-tetrahydrodipicolinate reductase